MCELDEQDKRIEQILGRFDMDVGEESSLKYMDYLKRNIEFPCQLTGIEDFPWEEYYVFGPGSKKEYEKLKKNNHLIQIHSILLASRMILMKIMVY